jgi:hypothetical protein
MLSDEILGALKLSVVILSIVMQSAVMLCR